MRTRNGLKLRIAIGGICAAAAHSASFAQASGEAAGPGDMMVIEEIVVTAEKREEKLQDVPVAVSAYSDAARDTFGIRNIEDFASFTPGLSFASNDRLSVRGVGRLTNALGSDPGVATYNDGFYTSSTTETNKSSLFVQRVEFLRGPQGTLYGRNSMGGAINVISKRPTAEFEGEVRGIYGSYDQKNLEGSFSGPITDSIRFRAAASSQNRDEGYFENDAGDDRYRQNRRLFELQLEADFGENLKGWVKLSSQKWDDDNSDASLNAVLIDPYYGVPTTGQAPASAFPTGSLVPNAQYLATNQGKSNPAVNDPFHISENTIASTQLDDSNAAIFHLTWDLGGTALKYVGGIQESYLNVTQEQDLTSLVGPINSYTTAAGATVNYQVPVFPEYVSEFIDDKNSYSNEINWSSNGDGPHHWIVGLYQFHEEQKNPVSLYAPRQVEINSPFVRVNGVLTAAAPNANGRYYFADGAVEVDSYAAFGQLDYAFSDAWSMTFGLRYSLDEKTGTEFNRLVAFNPIVGGTGTIAIDSSPALNRRTLEDDWSNVSGKLGVQWKPSEDALLYASYNRGYKSGGFNLGTIIGGADPSAAMVDEEILNALEVGFKTNLRPNVQFNGSVFYYLYDDAQVPLAQFRNGVNLTTFQNIDSTNFGAEIETVYAATEHLSFLLNYSYLNTENTRECQYRGPNDFNDCYYDNADPQAVAPGANRVGQDAAGNWLQNLDGNSLPQAPENKVAFNTTYRLDFSPGSLSFSGSYSWQDETTYALFANPAFEVPSYGMTDVRILWNDLQDRYTVIAFVDNATDEEGYTGADVTALSQGARRTRRFSAPRTYGLEVQYRF